MADLAKKSLDKKGVFDPDAMMSTLWQKQGPQWIQQNKDQIMKHVNPDQLRTMSERDWRPWLLTAPVGKLIGVPQRVPVMETLRQKFGSQPTDEDKRNVFIRAMLGG